MPRCNRELLPTPVTNGTPSAAKVTAQLIQKPHWVSAATSGPIQVQQGAGPQPL